MGTQIIPICAQQMMIAKEPLGAHIGGSGAASAPKTGHGA
jgi:hypothetical protein